MSKRRSTAALAGAFSTGMPIARAGLDIALHDPSWEINRQDTRPALGIAKRVDSLTLSWTVNPQQLEEVEGLIEEGKRRGYEHFNIKVAPDPKFDVELGQDGATLGAKWFFVGGCQRGL